MGENLTIFEIRESPNHVVLVVKILSCCYRAQKHSWIDWDLFTKLMKEVNRKFTSQDRKIALIIGNCSAHPKVDALKALELSFYHPTQSQKLSQCYQKFKSVLLPLIKRYITNIGRGRSPRNINTLEAMTLLTATWECVSQETFVNFFKKAGISSAS